MATHCVNCTFAEWRDNHQIGCYISKLSQFQKLGSKYTALYFDSTNKKYYFIVNGHCYWHRPNGWADNHSLLKKIEICNKQTRIYYDAIVYLSEKIEDNKLNSVIKNLDSQTIKPTNIYIIQHYNGSTVELLKSTQHVVQTPVMILKIINGVINTKALALEHAIKQIASPCFIIYDINNKLDNCWIENINTLIFDKLQHIDFIEHQNTIFGTKKYYELCKAKYCSDNSQDEFADNHTFIDEMRLNARNCSIS